MPREIAELLQSRHRHRSSTQPYAFPELSGNAGQTRRTGRHGSVRADASSCASMRLLSAGRTPWPSPYSASRHPPVAPTTAQANQPPVEALLIGDSVLNGLAQPYSAAGRAALAARHSFILDTAGCRRLITTSCRIPPAPAPTNAITVLRARAGQYDRALVDRGRLRRSTDRRVRNRRSSRRDDRRGAPAGHRARHLAHLPRGGWRGQRRPLPAEQRRAAQPAGSRTDPRRLGGRAAPGCPRVGSRPMVSTSVHRRRPRWAI